MVSISDLVVASRIWTKLRDLDSSQALAFEWSKSATYKKYLSSLGIDVRNVSIADTGLKRSFLSFFFKRTSTLELTCKETDRKKNKDK